MNTRFAGVVFAFLVLTIIATIPLRPDGRSTTNITQTDTVTTSPTAYQTTTSDSISGITIACLILGAAAIGQVFFRPRRRAVQASEVMSTARTA